MSDISAEVGRPGIMVLGRRVLRRNLAVLYGICSLFIIIILGIDVGSAVFLPFAVLFSWVGLLALGIAAPLESLFNHHVTRAVPAIVPASMAIFLFIFVLFYLLILFLITKTTFRFSRIAGLIAPILFHFLGVSVMLMHRPGLDLWMLAGSREAFYYAGCVISLALIAGYIFICWKIVNKAKVQKTL